MLRPPDDRQRSSTPIEQGAPHARARLSILLGLLAIVAGAVFLMLKMDGGS